MQERLQKLDPTTWTNTLELAQKQERSMEDLLADIERVSKEKFVVEQSANEDELLSNSLRIVYNDLIKNDLVKTDVYEVYVGGISPAVPAQGGKKARPGKLYGIGRRADDDESPFGFFSIAFFEDDALRLQKAKVGTLYRIHAPGRKYKRPKEGVPGGITYDLNANGKTDFNNSIPLPDGWDAKAALRRIFPALTIKEANKEENKSVDRFNDFRLLPLEILFAPSEKNNRATAKDSSLSQEDLRKGLTCTVFMDSGIAKDFGQNSRMLFVGTVTPGGGPGKEQFPGPTLNAVMAIPEFKVPHAMRASQTQNSDSGESPSAPIMDMSDFDPTAQ